MVESPKFPDDAARLERLHDGEVRIRIQGGTFRVECSQCPDMSEREPGPRGDVVRFSSGSRKRLMRLLNSLDRDRIGTLAGSGVSSCKTGVLPTSTCYCSAWGGVGIGR
jgi:hypothetical protein